MEHKKFNCEKCNYSSDLKSCYDQHLQSGLHQTGHRKIRADKKALDKYTCEKCGYETRSEPNYKTHILHNHASQEEKKKSFKYYCDACDFGTQTESTYNLHIDTKKHQMKSKK